MDMNHHHHFRPELHIAQQSRRDKLRINQNDSPNHGFYFNNLEQIPNPNDNWRPAAAGNICYDMPVFCSDPTVYQSYDPADPQYFTTWKSIGSQSSGDWVTNHSNPIPYHDNNNNLASDFSNANYQNALQELVTPSSGVRIGTQALSLSLSSSVPSPRVHKDICVTTSNVHHHHEAGTWKKPEMGRVPGPAQTLNHRNPGPLGPFTGYATILTSSKFLRPAQQLLEELCCMARPKDIEICEDNRSLEQLLRVSNDCNEPSSFFIKDKSREPPPPDSFGPENLQRKAKLLYMQDEVCKRYKQYHQQMQMVVSSFESVAGLSAATPYVSLALKMISKHFRCLKNTITDQLKSIKNSLGEELASPSSSSKGDAGVSMLKFFDQNFQKQKGAAGANLGILETQHIWRPQRGLPERAVSILRAWLFDHFLHPYPTDTDKHMLATQTGLTRNQVSNWFINARVRVWKPMVEEIHMLETKGGVADQTESSSGGKTTLEGCDHQPANDQSSSQSMNRLRMSAISDKQVECSTIGPSGHEYEVGRNIWNQEKRSRIEYQMIPSSIDGSLMGLVPSGIEMGGLGSVSLTLGLRQSAAENAQQRQPEHHLRPHMGGQIIRDFVG